jgi:hypothetical protein
MPSLDDFLSKKEKKEYGEFQETSGTYPCQKCELDVYEAKYYTDKAELVWYCSQGHRSFVNV